jgi:hypothetical protein
VGVEIEQSTGIENPRLIICRLAIPEAHGTLRTRCRTQGIFLPCALQLQPLQRPPLALMALIVVVCEIRNERLVRVVPGRTGNPAVGWVITAAVGQAVKLVFHSAVTESRADARQPGWDELGCYRRECGPSGSPRVVGAKASLVIRSRNLLRFLHCP